MSNLSSFLKLANSSESPIPIGDVLPVIVNTSNVPATLANGAYVKTGGTYSKASYPLLFNIIGQIFLTPSYDTTNLFYVPNINHKSVDNRVSLSGVGTNALIVYYMKARPTSEFPLASLVKTKIYQSTESIQNVINNGNAIRASNTVYLQSAYPGLYAQLGLITGTGVSYNTSTEFIVPQITENYSISGVSGSPTVVAVPYIRARL
jgi:hypothetical protein